MKRYLLQAILFFIIQSCYSQQPLTKVLNNKKFEEIQINFSTNKFDKYVVRERIVNVSEGEIIRQVENIDTIFIRCVENSKTEIIYEIIESKNDMKNSLYDRSVQHLIKDDLDFPTIRYIKNRISKVGIFPDSCMLSNEVKYHLNKRIELLKEIRENRDVSSWEKLIDKIDHCRLSNYTLLHSSRILIALDNYLVPVDPSDTLIYRIIQKEHFGIEACIASSFANSGDGGKLICLDQFEEERNDKEEFGKILSANKSGLSESQIIGYQKVIKSINASNRISIELTPSNHIVRFMSKIYSTRLNSKNGIEIRVYNYEIKKIDDF
jgi:hypothetical protein